MDIRDIRKKSDEELRTLLAELQGQMQSSRFQIANMQLKNIRSLRECRKDIARVYTELQRRISDTQSQQTS